MRIQTTKPLFAWDALEDSPTLKTIRQLLEVIPHQTLLDSLRFARGKGRNDVPVRVAWGVLVLSIALRHPTIEACLGELRRNESLRKLIGIESEDAVPEKWNLSRFLDRLGQEPHLGHLHGMFDAMIGRLGSAVPDLGRAAAGDATSLNARRKRANRAGIEPDEGLPRASGGRKEYTDEKGNVTKVVEWFGFKLHLLVDVKHEVSLAYQITDTKAGDGETLPAILAEAQANLPEGRIETLAYDKAADSNDVHALLAKNHIRAVIQNRSLWKDQQEQMLPGHDGNSNVRRSATRGRSTVGRCVCRGRLTCVVSRRCRVRPRNSSVCTTPISAGGKIINLFRPDCAVFREKTRGADRKRLIIFRAGLPQFRHPMRRGPRPGFAAAGAEKPGFSMVFSGCGPGTGLAPRCGNGTLLSQVG